MRMPAKSTPAKSTAAKPAAAKPAADVVVLLGSTSIQPAGRQGGSAPAGSLHLVDGWDALCGSGRVRFVFPGRVAAEDTCPECVQATRPRPRPAARPATRSRARAS